MFNTQIFTYDIWCKWNIASCDLRNLLGIIGLPLRWRVQRARVFVTINEDALVW